MNDFIDKCSFSQYGHKEMDYLKDRDRQLGVAIDRIGLIQREIISDLFTALVSNVISQLISKKAAKTVWNRLSELLGTVTPESITSTKVDEIQACGMSFRKAECIKGIAEAAVTGKVDFNELHMLTDEEIIKKLSSLSGVGVWTAEMILIFTLNRPDVVSYHDLAIRKGMMRLYSLEKLSKKEFDEYRARYSPFGSVASLYLWEISLT